MSTRHLILIAFIASCASNPKAQHEVPPSKQEPQGGPRDPEPTAEQRDATTALRIAHQDPRCVMHGERMFTCAFATKEDCEEFNTQIAEPYHLRCARYPSRVDVANARAEEEAAANRKRDAEALATQCQRILDGDLEAGIACWMDHHGSWQNLDADVALVPSCLKDEQDRVRHLRDCVSLPERTDDEILEKQRCLEAFHLPGRSAVTRTCTPLQVDAIDSKIAQDVGYDAVKQHVDSLAVNAKARVARCKGKLAAGLVARIRFDSSITGSQLAGCAYKIIGTVETTTRDGWTIVQLAENLECALRASTRYVDGAFVRIDNASFVGVRSFARVDGSMMTVATFKLLK